MRKIKFRIWAKNHDCMHYSDDSGLQQIFDWFERYEGSILMQYTGLKDKNGKEIYEGDVLRGYGSAIKRFVVSFSNGSFVLYHNFGRWGLLSRIFEIEELPVEIIGNLYENPELLNQ